MRIEQDTVRHGRRAWQADTQHLRRTSFFHGVRDEELKPLAAATMCRIYGRKEVVVGAGGEAPTFCLIMRGLARLFHDSEHGEELTLHLLHDGGAYDPALLMAMRSKTVRSRLEWTLQRLAGWNQRHVVPLDYDVLASVVGASRQAVTRELGNLRDEGLVEFQPHHRDGCIVVPNPSRLCAANSGAM